jgi:alpha-galactosidase
MLLFSILSFCIVKYTAALDNGVGKLPKMGYDSKNHSFEHNIKDILTIVAWNAFACDYDQERVIAQAQAMVKHGLVGAGYNSIILDDCFTLRNRSIDGRLVEGWSP